jgi:tRNA C32,U32 (ribose-2'-O)-methylase TrmJ
MARFLATGVGLALLLPTALNPIQAQEKPTTEKQKIEALIKHVEGMKDAKFVRNDKEYDAKTAAKFLRGKWEAKEAEIKTAKDFIEKVASASSTTGKPYLIRPKDGKEMKSGEYLLAELKKLE